MLNVDFDTTMSGVLNIDVEEDMAKSAAEGTHFTGTVTLDPQEDEEVEKYADKIVAVGVGNITATVITVSKSDVIVMKGSEVIVTSKGKTDAKYILPDEWSIVVGNSFQLENQDGFYGEVDAILKDVNPFTIDMDGYSSVSGVTIGLKFSIDATVTGSPF
ncbi:MAG: hypothetical protein QNK35_13980 [Bacteroides sp.]|nr:hypothetical protein [Bacteroides sp.]